MRAVLVIVSNVLGQHLLEMTVSEDEGRSRHSWRTVPTNRSANAFAPADRTGVLMTLMPSVRRTSSKLDVNFVSLSRMRNLAGRDRPVMSKVRMRACWVVHSRTGLAVMPLKWTRRVSSSMKNST